MFPNYEIDDCNLMVGVRNLTCLAASVIHAADFGGVALLGFRSFVAATVFGGESLVPQSGSGTGTWCKEQYFGAGIRCGAPIKVRCGAPMVRSSGAKI